MYCMQRYHFNFIDFLHGNYSVSRHCFESVRTADVIGASFLQELVYLREGSLTFSNDLLFLDHNDIMFITDYVACS